MNLVLFFIMIIISMVAVRIGAIAFQRTGLTWSLSKFQALSCFTGTGFTTREAELIVSNPHRRKIATTLMIVGNAGLVGIIATFANSLRAPDYISELEIPYMHLFISTRYLPWVNLLIIIVCLYIGYKIITHTKIARRITANLKKYISKKKILRSVSFEEMMVLESGYGVMSFDVTRKSPLLNKKVGSIKSEFPFTILMVERKGESLPIPSEEEKLLLGDRVIFFGKLRQLKQKFLNTAS